MNLSKQEPAKIISSLVNSTRVQRARFSGGCEPSTPSKGANMFLKRSFRYKENHFENHLIHELWYLKMNMIC